MWRKILARRYRRQFPRVSLGILNFVDHPIETIESLLALSVAEREEVNAYLDFEDGYCNDIGAYLVLAEIWPQLSEVFRGGKMPRPVQKVLDGVGLGDDLKIHLPAVRDHDNIWPFKLRRRRTRGTTHSPTAQLKPQDRELLNDELIAMIDQWLEAACDHLEGEDSPVIWQLTGEGKSDIANMIGEILDNAERHSVVGGDGDWTMAAFMAKRETAEGAVGMHCFMSFLSVGRSIAETIKFAPERMRKYCDSYAKLHSRSGVSRETLYTIAALQDGVTSNHAAFDGNRGGTGLQETLDMIGKLGGAPQASADAKVTILSGSSCIKLKHPILVGRRDRSNNRVQWCNSANDPQYPPDRNVAFDLPAHFAGTLVSVAFTLNTGLFVHEGDDDDQRND